MRPSHLSLMAALFAAAGKSITAPLREFEEFQRRTPSLAHINKYRPHQGKRECARRRGGKDWMDYRNADRQRRGLRPRFVFLNWIPGSGKSGTTGGSAFNAGFRDTSNDGGYVQ